MIHERAVVSSDARVHEEATIGPYAIVGPDVEIGARTRLEPHVVVKGATAIGEDNHIYQFASIGDDPQDKKYAAEPTKLTIGDRNTIREFCTIRRGTVQGDGETTMGNDNWIMAYVHIAHDCHIGSNTIFANNATLAGHVHIGDWAIMAGFSGAHQFCRVGAHAFLGMYSGVSRDVPPYTMVFGTPGAPRGINSEGLKRRDFSTEQIRNIKEAYRVVYRKGLKLDEAIVQLEQRLADQPELAILLESLRSTERGIIR